LLPSQLATNGHQQKPQAVTGACLAISANSFSHVQGFDSSFINGQEDTDLSFRLQLAHTAPQLVCRSQVTHAEARTPGRHKANRTNRQLFRQRWPDTVSNRITLKKRQGNMNHTDNLTPLQLGNKALREGQLIDAIHWYETAVVRNRKLGRIVGNNLDWAYRLLDDKTSAHRAKRRLTIESNLKPIQQLEAGTSINQWISLGEDPFFELKAPAVVGEGPHWYKFRFVIQSTSSDNVAKIYFDLGNDYAEENTLSVPYTNNQAITRILRLPSPPTRLRFDPIETPGAFEIKALAFDAIGAEQATKHMLCRLLAAQEGRRLNPEQLSQHLQQAARAAQQPWPDHVYQQYQASLLHTPQTQRYRRWIEKVEKPSLPDDATLCQTIQAMSHAPLISLIMPTYNTNAHHLQACIDSVLAQKYPNWELCIADDASTQPHMRALLEHYEANDSRIKVAFRKENGHISRASNTALELASGDFVALLDHDDTLPPHALYFVAQAIAANPDARIIYSDEDKIDEQGQRFSPHFKSDWNPDLFYSQNYVCHLGVYRRELLETIGGFRAGVEGSQDQDLLLRCLPHVSHQHITHIPRVLYHWRISEGSTAQSASAKSYTTQAGIKALQDHLREQGQNAVTVEAGLLPNTYRLRWPIPTPAPMVSLIIPTRDKKAVVELAVRSILDKTSYPNYEILLIDNGSQEPDALQWLEDIQQDPRARVLRYDYPFNYSAINNFGAQFAQGEVLGLVNNDVEVISPDWMTELTSHALRPDIGCVGAKLYYPNDTVQHAGIVMGVLTLAGHSHRHSSRKSPGYFGRLVTTQNLPAVTGACLFVRKHVYEEVGGLNEMQLKIAFNDVDFCLRVQEHGLRNLWTPFAELYHHESISRGAEDTPEKQARFQQEVQYMQTRWASDIARSRYYSPNLTRQREDFSIQES
jgi:glycosyltransferase involved in cell wall biosynthesis